MSPCQYSANNEREYMGKKPKSTETKEASGSLYKISVSYSFIAKLTLSACNGFTPLPLFYTGKSETLPMP